MNEDPRAGLRRRLLPLRSRRLTRDDSSEFGTAQGSGPAGSSGRLQQQRQPPRRPPRGALYSGSEGDSESGEEEELGAERRGLKRSLSEMELGGGGSVGPRRRRRPPGATGR
nr:serum response factor-like [Vicugna pacos]